MNDEFVECRIVTGLIISVEYLTRFSNQDILKYFSTEAKTIARWCLDYFEIYAQPPKVHIWDIFLAHKKELGKATATAIEDILGSLNDDYEKLDFNFEYLCDETVKYFTKQSLIQLADGITAQVNQDKITQAKELLTNYESQQPAEINSSDYLDKTPDQIREAFESTTEPLFTLPGKLGKFLDLVFCTEQLVGIMGHEKMGKTFLLMELAISAVRQGNNVIFFEVGDMSTKQLDRRMGIRLSGKSDLPKYCKEMFIPVLDCFQNQTDICRKDERECNFGIFDGMSIEEIEKKTKKDLEKEFQDNPKYLPCSDCRNSPGFTGAVWYRQRSQVDPLSWQKAYHALEKFQKSIHHHFKLIVYPNDTCGISDIKSEIVIIEKRERWTPTVVIIDYADLLTGPGDTERERQNSIWKKLRALSQERHCLVITATQADAGSYKKPTLSKTNFSEDKRKYAHVNYMIGIHNTNKEKEKGIIRVSKLMGREEYFNESKQITVLQSLETGRFFVGSY